MTETSLALLFEYLDAALQPTFVVRLSTSTGTEDEPGLIHANPALSRLETLHTEIARQINRSPGALNLLGARGHSPTDQGISAVSFCGIAWNVTFVGSQWAVVASTESHLSPNSPNSPNGVHRERSSLEDPSTINRHGGPEPSTPWSGIAPQPTTPTTKPLLGFVNSHGHLGDLEYLEWMRQYDWNSSPVGPIDSWPSELRSVCEYALATPDPINVIWGGEDQLTLLYNQAYSIVVGDKHPRAMGRPFKENFEQWPEYHRVFDRMKQNGQSVRQDKIQRMLVRDGHLEEAYFDFLLAPVLLADGSVAGFTTRIHETTRQVVFERRMQVLAETSKAIATIYTVHDLCVAAAATLDNHTSDIHFAAIYSAEMRDCALDLKLEAMAGATGEAGATRNTGTLESPQFGLQDALQQACKTREPIALSTDTGNLPQTTLDQLRDYGVAPCREIVVYPLKCFVEDNIAAVMIIGTSPLRKFDEDYRSFLRLLTRQIENAITVAKGLARERELHRAQLTSEMEMRFLRFAEEAPVGMFIYNAEDALTFWNTAFEDICGVRGSDLSEPMAWLETIHPDSVPEVTAVWESYNVSRRDESISYEVQFKKPWTSKGDGTEAMLDRTYALGVIQPDYAENGRLKGTLGCITDISSVKWAEKMQSAQLAEAIEQRRQQENFLDVTSHEMRNPLNAIFQCAHELTENITFRLRENNLSHEQAHILHESLDLATTITYCANHQKRIVDDVLTLSKLDARLLQIYPESTNPIKLYRKILSLFGPEIRAAGMNTNYMVGEGYNRLDLKRVMMDPSRVTQIVINLLSNAIKFTKEGKKRDLEMTLNAHLEEPANKPMGTRYVPSGVQHHDPTGQPEWGQGETIYLSFSVKDSGLGMTPEEASNLFQKFSQASPRTHTQFGGSGLGLYISRNLAELHGGRIGLKSQAGFGSTFEFYIKVRRDQTLEMPITPIDKALATVEMERKVVTSPVMQQARPAGPGHALTTESRIRSSSAVPPRTNVLIVEDNLINQRLLCKLIKKHGYDTTTANNGEEALALMANSTWNPERSRSDVGVSMSIDIVLCDIEMPIMDGKTCARRVRQLQQANLLRENIPMIAITGNARQEQVEEMRQCGFDDVVTKPYKIDQLLRVIERYVEGSGRQTISGTS